MDIISQTALQKITLIYWKRYIGIYPKLRVYACPTIVINNRFRSTAGINRSENNIIELAGKYFANNMDNMLNIILPHELAHQIDFNLNGWFKGKKHHGNSWRKIMIDIGLPAEAYHTMVL